MTVQQQWKCSLLTYENPQNVSSYQYPTEIVLYFCRRFIKLINIVGLLQIQTPLPRRPCWMWSVPSLCPRSIVPSFVPSDAPPSRRFLYRLRSCGIMAFLLPCPWDSREAVGLTQWSPCNLPTRTLQWLNTVCATHTSALLHQLTFSLCVSLASAICSSEHSITSSTLTCLDVSGLKLLPQIHPLLPVSRRSQNSCLHTRLHTRFSKYKK